MALESVQDEIRSLVAGYTSIQALLAIQQDERAAVKTACVKMARALLDKTRSATSYHQLAVRWLNAARCFSDPTGTDQDIALVSAQALQRLKHFRAAKDEWTVLAEDPGSPHQQHARDQASACAQSLEQLCGEECKQPKTVLQDLEASPIKALRNFGAKTVSPFAKGGDTPLAEAVAALDASPSLTSSSRSKKLQGLLHALTATPSGPDNTPDVDATELLAEFLPNQPSVNVAARILSWNIKLANVTDAKGNQLRNMIKSKMANIAQLAVKMQADAIVLQELPGSFYELKGSDNHKAAVKDAWVKGELARALLDAQGAGTHIVEYDFREVAIHKWVGHPGDVTKDEGEHHLFAWDKSKYTVVKDPVALEPADGEAFHRAPCWMLLQDQTIDSHLALVSCHLKSGGQELTLHDAKLMALQCHALVERLRTEHGEVAMLVLGDFNLDARQVQRAFHTTHAESDFASLLDLSSHIPSNMYRFTANGEAVNGHAYDGAFLNSPKHSGTAVVHDTNTILPKVTQEMEAIGKAIHDALPEWTSLSKLTQAALKSLKPKAGATDNVPALIRNLYREEVARQWSDHVPVSVEIVEKVESRIVDHP
eukprot:m.215469 g.215469  ORF g.215469 m.215469 type:complete len:597 (+) comp17199_c0_seq2:91-1881(+)